MSTRFWIGTYAAKGGLGLYPLTLRPGGELDLGLPTTAIRNASFALSHPDMPIAWFVNEQEDGRVVSAALKGGAWEVLGDVPSGGSLPCFLARHPTRDLLAVANYADGAVTLLPLDATSGIARAPCDRVLQSGRGPDLERQAGPHAHCVAFSADGNFLYHVDLGLDRVWRYAVTGQRLGPAEVVFEAPAGWGARHLALLPDGVHAVLICEMAATCMLLRLDGKRFACLDSIPTAPTEKANIGGDLRLIALDRLLVTNRGHDSVALVRIEDGRLQREAERDSAGSSPRHVLPVGQQTLIAHEEAGGVVLLPLPGAKGTWVRSVSIPGAAFILEPQE